MKTMNDISEKPTDKRKCLSAKTIADYHEGRLTKEEMRIVEEHVADCPLCSDALEGYEFVNKETFEQDISEIRRRIDERSESGRKFKSVIYSVAALIAVFAISFLFGRASDTPAEEIFARYFKPFPDVTVQMRGENNRDEFKTAMLLYDAGNYKEAIEKFNDLMKENPDEKVRFYGGVAYLAAGEYENGIKLLSEITSDNRNEFYAEANWYCGLAEIRLHRIENALRCFDRIKKHPDYEMKISKIKKELK
jgi:tetratricopeptide (TPR) repeat protein